MARFPRPDGVSPPDREPLLLIFLGATGLPPTDGGRLELALIEGRAHPATGGHFLRQGLGWACCS